MKKKDIFIIVLISILLGIVAMRQFYITKGVDKLRSVEENQLLAVEVSRLLKANTDLRLEINELSTTLENYQKSLSNRKSAAEEVLKNLEKYQVIASKTRVEGQGVEIIIESATREQMVDLINALKNIGIEAISINGNRLNIASFISYGQDGLYLDDKKLERPYKIEVIGEARLIKESLERTGGIIETIKGENKDIKVTVSEKEKIVLGAYN